MKKTLDDILHKVRKPSRYIGQEINSYNKDITKGMIRFGFSYPDVYEVGMSYLGMHIIYNLLNEQEDIYCERIFSPWTDLEKLMREEEIPASTLETNTPLHELDVVGFTLQYELSYTNILNLLDLGGVELFAKDRTDESPIVLAGGPCAYNPEPMAPFIDVFLLGEGEELLLDFFSVYKKYKNNMDRDAFLKEVSQVEGVYVPKFYSVDYTEKGTISSFEPIADWVPKKVKKRIIKDFDKVYSPDKMIVPFLDTIHNRAVVEIFRGCTKGCRFCQAGMIYRPVREKSYETIVESAINILKNTGYGEIALSSLSTLDHTEVKQVITRLLEEDVENKIGVSLPSLRLDSLAVEVLKEIQKVRKTGLTFAPEAGTQRLRDVINKGVTEEDLVKTMEEVFSLGWNRVKLYFMIGLPTETIDDLTGIADVANLVTYTHKQIPRELRANRRLQVTVSASCFVPKPFTPFQWFGQDTMESFSQKQTHLKKKLNNRKVKFNYHDAETSFLEGVIARGDRKIGQLIYEAWKLGCKFDGWDEYFDLEKWQQAFKQANIDPEFYANRTRAFDEILPWDHIDVGVSKAFLKREYDKALNGETTNDCRDNCVGCGITATFPGGVC